MIALLGAHIAASLALGIIASAVRGRKGRLAWAAAEFWTALLVPVVGAVAVLAQLALEVAMRRAVEPADARSLLEPGGSTNGVGRELARPLSELRIGVDAVPFDETLRAKETRAVELAMNRLARDESPTSLDRLREAVYSSDLKTRVRARGVLVRLEDRLVRQIRTTRDPALRGRAFLKLAHLSTDPGTARKHLEQSAAEYRAACEQDAPHGLLLELGRVHLQLGELESARDTFGRHIARHVDDPEGYIARAEANFRLGDADAVRTDYERAAALDARLSDLVRKRVP